MTTIDTGTDDLLATVEEGVAVLTMNRPERRNAMSGEMNQALGRVLADVEVDDDVAVVVVATVELVLVDVLVVLEVLDDVVLVEPPPTTARFMSV